jgi:hypothetical protein
MGAGDVISDMARPSIFSKPETLSEMIGKYNDGASPMVVALAYNVSPYTIRHWLRKSGVERRLNLGRAALNPFNDRRRVLEMIKRYQDGEPMSHLILTFKTSYLTIRNVLIANGVEVRRQGGGRRIRHMLYDDEGPICHGKNYAEYLADAVKRGDRTIKAVVGSAVVNRYIS